MKAKEKNADKEIRTSIRSGGTRDQKGIEDRRLITNNQYFKHSTASAFCGSDQEFIAFRPLHYLPFFYFIF
jgi:hypothetical protein